MEAYDVTFGVFDHINQSQIEKSSNDPNNKRPLTSIALHKTEEVSEVSLLYERIASYSDKKVNDYFKLSLMEFLDLPRDIVEHILKICDTRLTMDNNMHNDVLKQLNK